MNRTDVSGGPRLDLSAVSAIVAAAGLAAIALLRSRFLPFVDLPQHIALAQLLDHASDPAVSRLYEASLLPQVNVLGLAVMAALLRVLSETSAVSMVLVMYLAGLAWSLRRLARSLGVSEWSAVLALLFAVNFNLWYGFISFCLGIPVTIFIFARLSDPCLKLRPLNLCAEVLLWLLLLLAHALLFAFGLAASLLWFAVAPRPVRERALRLAPVVPAIVWLALWWISGEASAGVTGGSGVNLEWHGVGVKLAGFGWSMIVAGGEASFEWVVLGAVGVLAAVLASLELRARWSLGRIPRVGSPRSPRERSRKPLAATFTGSAARGSARPSVAPAPLRFAPEPRDLSRMRLWVRLMALAAFLLYCFLPYAITSGRFETRGIFLLYNRFLVLAPMLIIPTLPWPASIAIRRGLALATLALHVALAWHWDGLLRRTAAEAQGLDGAVSAMAPGKIVKSLIYTPYPEGLEFPSFLHAASYYQARRLGEVDQSFALLPDTPVHYRDPDRPYLSRYDEHLFPQLFNWDRAELYDYVLVHDRGGAWRSLYSAAPYRRIYEKNGWMVLDVNKGVPDRSRQ